MSAQVADFMKKKNGLDFQYMFFEIYDREKKVFQEKNYFNQITMLLLLICSRDKGKWKVFQNGNLPEPRKNSFRSLIRSFPVMSLILENCNQTCWQFSFFGTKTEGCFFLNLDWSYSLEKHRGTSCKTLYQLSFLLITTDFSWFTTTKFIGNYFFFRFG